MSENYKVAHILLAEVLYREELRIQIVESLKSTVFDNFDIILNYFKSENMIKNISNELIIRTILTNICGYVMSKYIFNPNGNYDDDKELKYIEELNLLKLPQSNYKLKALTINSSIYFSSLSSS